MTQERRDKIVELVNKNNTISNDEIMSTFGVSIETVRRDLAFLEGRGLLERVYGGAVKKKFLSVEPKYLSREGINPNEKLLIANEAQKLILDRDSVFFDLGTTVQLLAKNLSEDKKITAFTNSLRMAIALSDKGQTVVLPGGVVRSGEYSVSGSISEDCMSSFNIDKAFIGVAGITEDGFTDFDIDEARLRAKIIKNAQKVVVLADYSKFNIRSTCKVCDIKDVDILITDDKAPADLVNFLEKSGVQVVIVK